MYIKYVIISEVTLTLKITKIKKQKKGEKIMSNDHLSISDGTKMLILRSFAGAYG